MMDLSPGTRVSMLSLRAGCNLMFNDACGAAALPPSTVGPLVAALLGIVPVAALAGQGPPGVLAAQQPIEQDPVFL